MPKYYCEYCDIYLTHSSAGGRRQHNSGRKHINNKIEYYQTLIREKNLAPPMYPVPPHLAGMIRPGQPQMPRPPMPPPMPPGGMMPLPGMTPLPNQQRHMGFPGAPPGMQVPPGMNAPPGKGLMGNGYGKGMPPGGKGGPPGGDPEQIRAPPVFGKGKGKDDKGGPYSAPHIKGKDDYKGKGKYGKDDYKGKKGKYGKDDYKGKGKYGGKDEFGRDRGGRDRYEDRDRDDRGRY